MKKIYLLSKENIDFAKEEVLALSNAKDYAFYNDLLIVSATDKTENRLAYTKAVYKFLFLCKEKDLINNLKKFNWHRIYKKNFCLRMHNKKYSEKELAGFIWRKLKNPKVKLENPETKIEIFFAKGKALAGLLIKEIKEPFNERRAHLRPELHPSSLHPRLARCIVNLTGIKKGIFTDPFCGTGGILIEAGLMGLNPIGYDNDERMLWRAEQNLRHFKIKKYKLKKADATALKNKLSYVATDLPYGKNTKKQDLIKLYSAFLKNLKGILVKKAVIVFPHFINYRALIKKSGLNLKKEFTYYVHRGLTRKIAVLTP